MIQKLEKWFVILVLFYTSGAVWVALSPTDSQSNPTAGNPLLLGLELLVYGGAVFFTALNFKAFLQTALRIKTICLLMVYVVASSLWSQVPAFTFRRGLVMTGTTVIGIYIASRFSLREQLRLLAFTFLVIAVASIVMAVVPPHLGIEDTGTHVGAWRGAYIQKNYLGRYMTLGALSFFFVDFRNTLARWAGFGVCSVLILLSQSKSALAFGLILLAIIPLLWFLRLSINRLIPTALGLIAVVGAVTYAIVININTLLGLLGRDLTFSGRTQLWAMLWQKFLQHKLLGFGFDGFWPVEYISIWTQTVSWFPLHAHSGYFDLLLALGLVGAGIFLVALLQMFVRAIKFLRSVPSREGMWPLMLIWFVLIYNLSEVTLLHENSMFWIVFTLTAATVANKAAARDTQMSAQTAQPFDAWPEAYSRPVYTPIRAFSATRT